MKYAPRVTRRAVRRLAGRAYYALTVYLNSFLAVIVLTGLPVVHTTAPVSETSLLLVVLAVTLPSAWALVFLSNERNKGRADRPFWQFVSRIMVLINPTLICLALLLALVFSQWRSLGVPSAIPLQFAVLFLANLMATWELLSRPDPMKKILLDKSTEVGA